jgi:ATF/CREB family transcription factor
LKCRQRKKQWLANLQTKVEVYSSENDALASTIAQLREEVVNLKTLLMAHKDCPVSQAQGLNTMVMNSLPNEYPPHANPYGMVQQQGGIPAQGMPRR